MHIINNKQKLKKNQICAIEYAARLDRRIKYFKGRFKGNDIL